MSRWSSDRVGIEIVKGQRGFVLIEQDLIYRTDVLGGGDYIVLGTFHTDLSSEPWWIGWRLDRLEYGLPALVHDCMLQHRDLFPEFTRRDIDRVYREALLDQGIGETECAIRYAGVRINSWWREERHGPYIHRR